MRGDLVLLLSACIVIAGCDRAKQEPSAPAARSKQSAAARPANDPDACVRNTDFEPLKRAAFARAKAVDPANALILDQLDAAAVVRMDQPVVMSRDDALAVTLCRGTLVVDLPPGSIDAFSGGRQLTAPIDYVVQRTRDGVTQVHALGGADPIVYRLAAIGLAARDRPFDPALAAKTPAATAQEPRTGARHPRMATVGAGVPAPARAAPPRPTRGRPSIQPSFDCGSAQSRAEQMVCADAYLANLDRELVDEYSRAFRRSGPEGRARLERTRGRFLARLDRCERWACVEDVYQDRLEQIDRIAARD